MADWASRIVPPPMVPTSMEGMETEIWRLPSTLGVVSWLVFNCFLLLGGGGNLLLHDGHTAATLYILGWILAGGEEEGGDDVGCVGVIASDTSGHGTSD